LSPKPTPNAKQGNLDDDTTKLIDRHSHDAEALQVILFGRCLPGRTKLPSDLPQATNPAISVLKGETLQDAAARLELGWSPEWLFDAGHAAIDAGGTALRSGDVASASGSIQWDPPLILARVDDQTGDSKPRDAQERRIAGEIALAALWRRAATRSRIGADGAQDIRPTSDLNPNTRGARFKNALLYVLRTRLPNTWRVESELPLKEIYGLHLRRDVGERSSDIVVFDDRDRLVAIVSSKWTWRSDRGTEAAQMVPVRRYRPDVPYVLVTAEFPRLRSIARESVEDRAYSICPEWAAALLTLRELKNRVDGPRRFPHLDDLLGEAQIISDALELEDMADLADALNTSGRVG
jgi:hypothetical protein